MSRVYAVPVFIVDQDRIASTALKNGLELSGFTAVRTYDSVTSWWGSMESTAGIMIINDDVASLNLRDLINLVKEISPDMYILFLSHNFNPARREDGIHAGAFEYLLHADDIVLKIEAITREIESTIHSLEIIQVHTHAKASDKPA